MRILVTGAAGFIGAALSRRLIERGDNVIGIDNLNNYYDVSLKKARLERLASSREFEFVQMDIADRSALDRTFRAGRIERVVHLAAQAGVGYSLTNPDPYIQSNIVGFMNILESVRHHPVDHLVYASSSSVYGANTRLPFSVHDGVDHPVSLYAATKKSNELMAHVYCHLYGIPATGLRFFTVYGPWGRPDMSIFKFTRNILEDKPIDVYNQGHHIRDFTYIDDIIEGVMRVSDRPASSNASWDSRMPDPATSSAPYRIYNIGNNSPARLVDVIDALETALGRKARKNFLPLQPGDVVETHADINDLSAQFGWRPRTSIREGIPSFVAWYKEYYGVRG